jgi:hypothetical protein
MATRKSARFESPRGTGRTQLDTRRAGAAPARNWLRFREGRRGGALENGGIRLRFWRVTPRIAPFTSVPPKPLQSTEKPPATSALP